MVCVENFIYPYGIFYDVNRTSRPNPDTHDVLVYTNIRDETRVIGSLLGVFSTARPLTNAEGSGLVCRREQMPAFEEKHAGKFVPFE